MSSTSNLTFSLQNSTLPCSDKLTTLSNVPLTINRKSYNEESYNDLNIPSKEMIGEKDISNSTTNPSLSMNTNMEMQSDSSSTVYLIINSLSL